MEPGCETHRIDYPFFKSAVDIVWGENSGGTYITAIEQRAKTLPPGSSSQFTKEKQSPDTES